MSAHTPEPWTVEEAPHGFAVEPGVAWFGVTTGRPRSVTKANAHLTAAAPKLLASAIECQDAEDAMHQHEHDGYCDLACEDGRRLRARVRAAHDRRRAIIAEAAEAQR